jgi:hypothetical protein
MDTSSIPMRIYERMKTYSLVHEMVDTPKIANLAYEEFIVSFLEFMKCEGKLKDLVNLVSNEDNDTLRIKSAMLILPYDFDSAQRLVASCIHSKNQRVRSSARNLDGKMDSKLIEGYRTTIEKIRVRRKIL